MGARRELPAAVTSWMRRLGTGSLARLFRPRPVPGLRWFSLFDEGIAVALLPGTPTRDLRVVLTGPDGRVVATPPAAPDAVETPAGPVALFALEPGLLAGGGTVRLAVSLAGREARRRFVLGPGACAGEVEGVRDGCLVGWCSPLVTGADVSLTLLVDGRPGLPTAPNEIRREFLFASRRGGWDGFALPLPAAAFDGRPHRLAVRAGGTLLPFGEWSSSPRFHLDHVAADRVTGWYYDRAALDAASTIRLFSEGRTVEAVATHARTDLEQAFGRSSAAFAFTDVAVGPGDLIVAGPEGSGTVLGRIRAESVGDRVATERAAARALLLAGPSPEASLAERRAARDRAVAARDDPGTRYGFDPVGPDLAAGETELRPRPPRPPGRSDGSDATPACAIVPVYKGLADLRLCLESLLPQLWPGRLRAIVIDDGSPDPAIVAYLAGLAAEGRPGLTVLANESNQGFIATVNRGFSLLSPGEDALLVNADTILPPDLVGRLSRHCHARPGIASVTPFSNNATILGFPDRPEPNLPALGLDVAAIDRTLREIGAEPVELPTAVGFCVLLNGTALAEIGGFSPEWGRGYCEEVDWCLAARDLGWIHLAAADVFVMHEGSVSFGAQTRAEILAVNHARLETRYPEYVGEVHGFVAADPLEPVRTRALGRLLAGRFSRLTLHLLHGLGGGTRRYVDDLCRLPRDRGHEVGIARPVADISGATRLRLTFDASGTSLTISPDGLGRTLDVLEQEGLSLLLHVESRLEHDSALLREIAAGPRPYVVTLHDFQWYCPKVHLVDEREFYCGEPPPDICQLCVRGRHPLKPSHDFADQDALVERDIETWLAFNRAILAGAARLLAPSEDTASRYRARLGLAVDVLPHPETPVASPARPRRAPRSGPVRLAVVGAVGFHKGFELLVRIAERAALDRLPLVFRVVGYTPEDTLLTRLPNVEVTGAYGPGELAPRLAAFDPDGVFLPSVWPETYSYVLSEVWAAGYPVVGLDFGAPAERIRRAGGGVLLPPTRDAGYLAHRLAELRPALAALPLPEEETPPLPTLEDYYGPALAGRR